MQIDESVTVVNSDAIRWLTIHALNEMSRAADDAGCCPMCCAPCAAVLRLFQDGQLDEIVEAGASGYDWWNAERDEVDREWMHKAWRMTECHGDEA